VDPVNGDDATATGSGTAGGVPAASCAFKTVTAAIKKIGTNTGGPATTISIVGPSALSGGEVYPLTIPANTTVTTAGGKVTIALTGNNQVGVKLAAPGAGIDAPLGLVIDGSGSTGSTRGVSVEAGSDDSTFLRNVDIQSTPGTGVTVSGNVGVVARLTMGEGVRVRKSGTNNQPRFGVSVTDGGGFLTIVVAANEKPTVIEENTGGGIAVGGPSGISIKGVPGTNPDQGSVVLMQNGGPGLQIGQGGTASIPVPLASDVDGLVSYGNGTVKPPGASGIRVTWTSKVKIRNSVTLANSNHGIHVAPVLNVAVGATVGVDLGSAGDGHNTVQHTNQQGNLNLGVGVCFESGAGGVGLTLPAQGNVFGNNDCATSTATLQKDNACGNAKDYGVLGANTIDLTTCK